MGTAQNYLRDNEKTLALAKMTKDATIAPTANEDTDDGYSVGSIWVDATADVGYLCVDATATAAVWKQITA